MAELVMFDPEDDKDRKYRVSFLVVGTYVGEEFRLDEVSIAHTLQMCFDCHHEASEGTDCHLFELKIVPEG